MDLTSQAINEAEFTMARRGYDPDQVDEFLEKLAVAVDKQNEALAEAREQASMAERRAAEVERRASERPERVVEAAPAAVADRGPSPAEVSAAAEAELETLKRTLVLAQKTADATVREAEAEAQRMIETAEEEARTAQEGTRVRLLEEIGTLDSGREALRADVSSLERHIEEQRSRLRSAIAELQGVLDDPARLKSTPVPPLSGPAPADEHARPAVAPAPAAAPEPAVAEPPPLPPGPQAGDAAAEPDDDEAWARFGTGDDEGLADSGPPTQPVLRLDDLEDDVDPSASAPPAGDDAYLTELRKAMLDDTGAPGVHESFGDESGSRPRFGRRR